MSENSKSFLSSVCSRLPLLAQGLLLVASLQTLPVHAQSGVCYTVPFGATKIGATAKVSMPIDSASEKDVVASLISQKKPLLAIPKEVARIRRGYVSGFTSAYPNAEPVKSWFGVDLDRRAAYLVERYSYDANNPKFKAFTMPELNATTWARKWAADMTVEIEIVKVLPGNVGATNFSSFVCSANGLWASNPVSSRSGFTDMLSAYAYIVDVSADGKHTYVKRVMPGDPVDDAISGIRFRMH